MADDWKNAPIVSDSWEDAPVATKSEVAATTLKNIPWGQYNDPRGAALTLGSGAVAGPISGIAGIAGMIGGMVPGGESPSEKGARYVRGTQNALTIEPPNQASEDVLTGIGNLSEGVSKVGRAVPAAFVSFSQQEDLLAAEQFNRESNAAGQERFKRIVDQPLGESVFEATGSPFIATVTDTLPAAITSAVGMKNPLRGTPETPPVKPSSPVVSQPSKAVSVGRPSLDKATDFTPVQPDTIIAQLRKGKPAAVADSVIPDVKIIESAQRLGVDLNPEHYSTSAAFQDVARALKTQPGSKLQAKEVAALEALSRRADDLVIENNGHLDRAEFSLKIGSEIGSEIDSLKIKADVAYNQVRSAIPATTKVNPSLLRDHLDAKLAELGGNEKLLTPVEKQLLSLVRRSKDGDLIPPTYAALDRVRKNVGNGFSKQGPFADVDTAILSEVYGVLSDVQSGVARSFGVGDLYDSAKGLVASRKALEDQAVKLFGRNLSNSLTPQIKSAASGLVRGDIAKFDQLMETLPAARRAEAAATVMSELFAGGSRSGGKLGTGFAAAFTGLNRNVTAKNFLFSRLPTEARKTFNDIGNVLTAIIESNRKPMGNPSGTAGGIIKALDDMSFLEKAYGFTKKAAVAEGVSSSIGMPGVGTSGVVGAMLAKQKTPIAVAADEMLASPAFTRAINKGIEGDVSTANQIIENSPEFKRWSAQLDKQDAANIAKLGFIAWLTEDEE